MRRLLLIPLVLLAACQQEPDFETRYDDAQERIEETAKQIDAELNEDAPANETAPADDAREDRSDAR